MNSVSEKIDERILRLLSLEDVFDIDYDTYYTLIREAMVVGRDKIPQEELALLANERKRIRGKKGRFKPKKEKITADKVATIKFLKPAYKNAKLISDISNKDTQVQEGTLAIGNSLESISKTLAALLKFSKKTNEEERRDKESQKRTKREEGLEGFKKGISAVSGAAKKMLAPFQSIIDRIWKFIFFTLLGRAFTQLMDWLGNPANKKKIDVLGRFLKDWWPSLAFAAGLFLTPFGGFVRGTIGLLRAFIPQLIALTTNPAFLALAGATAGGIAGASLESNLRKVDETLLQRRIQESKDQGKPLSKQEIEKIKLDQLQKRVQDIQGTNLPGSALASGGIVPRFSMGGINFGTGYDGIDGSTGQKVSGFGPDTQAIIAQPGEIVINKKTVDAVGSDHFLALNRQYGGPGANKPKMGRLYNDGGEVERFQNGGIVGNMVNFFGGLGRKPQGLRGTPVKRIMHGTKAGVPELIRAGGFRGQTGMLGKGVYGSMKGWVADTYRGAGNLRGVLPGTGPRLDMLVPQAARTLRGATVVSESQANRGLRIAEGILSGRYTGAKARSLLPLLTAQTPSMAHALGTGSIRLGSKFVGALNAPVIGDMISPEGTSQYDQLSGPGAYYNAPGYKPIRKQGGGLIEKKLNPNFILPGLGGGGGGTDAITEQATDMSLGDRLKKFLFGEPKRGYDPQEYKGGGQVKENTGMDVKGATADRQAILAQPGEYMIPKDTVDRLRPSFFEKLVAMTDSNSNAARLGKGNINRPKITPLNRGQSGMMTLPPITQSASGGGGGGSAAGSKVPVFSASSPSGAAERSANTYNYGILG